jgi:sarcosine oxidase
MSANFEVIVLGVGGMGSAACLELARRGHRVLGLEQFPLVHSRGSSHGQTRIIRTAYYEHPAYVPLLRRAFDKWYELEQLTGGHLLTECRCMNVGPETSELVAGVRDSVREHGLAAEELAGEEIGRMFPAFRFPGSFVGILEANAGFLAVEECVRAHIGAASSLGVEIKAEEIVRDWKPAGSGVEVTTEKGTYRAAKLVVTAGAWATRMLADMGVPLSVMRQTLLWFDAGTRAAAFRRDNFPIFIADVPGGPFYGLPAIDRFGVKVARHYGAPELPDPDRVDWSLTEADVAAMRPLIDTYLPGLGGLSKGQVCMYTLTPDRHFVIDLHPHWPQVTVACGFSGHGFKFAPVVGEILADLAERGGTRHEVAFLGAKRFEGSRRP